jgi:hypothetical protein
MMIHMSSITTSTTTSRPAPVSSGPEQLTLLSHTGVSARFQLSQDIRIRGLRHIAEIRQQLAAAGTERTTSVSETRRAA